MNKYYNFSDGKWNKADFMSAASVRVPYRLDFEQKSDCIHNESAEEKGDEYAYVSFVLKDKVSFPCIIETECSFQKYGAPLIVLADEINTLNDGRLEYGRHIEVVGWENGINVWELYPDAASIGVQHSTNMGRFSFPISGGERFTLWTRVKDDGRLNVGARAGDREAEFECTVRVSENFSVGLTACEGKNYFYNFSISDSSVPKNYTPCNEH